MIECEYLRSHQGLLPGQPPLLAIGGGGGVLRKGRLSLLGRPSLPLRGGLPLFLPPIWGGGVSSCFPPPLWEESASSSSDDEGMTALRWGPLLVPWSALLGPPSFPDGAASSSSSPSPSREECASSSSDEASGVTLRRRPFRIPGAFFSAFFSGTL